jgi:hypothetical protein
MKNAGANPLFTELPGGAPKFQFVVEKVYHTHGSIYTLILFYNLSRMIICDDLAYESSSSLFNIHSCVYTCIYIYILTAA